ncbi:MAG: DUF2934 domain-containing protein [Acidobacteria bacterium]|nr:DUF2934 domain-containing protein [Acidobacteriota bacterium]MBI3427023.1 DUF2934 domain-containing protein [Acidobacteriota bacterium]
MTNNTTKGRAAPLKRAVKKAKLSAGIDLSDNPPLSAAELQAQIRRRAYELFLQRRPEAGSAEADWLQAEDEVAAALNATTAAPSAAPAQAKAPRAVRPRSNTRAGSTTTTPTRTRRKQPPATSKS